MARKRKTGEAEEWAADAAESTWHQGPRLLQPWRAGDEVLRIVRPRLATPATSSLTAAQAANKWGIKPTTLVSRAAARRAEEFEDWVDEGEGADEDVIEVLDDAEEAADSNSEAGEPFQRAFLSPQGPLSEEERADVEATRALLEVVVESGPGDELSPIASFEELGVLPEYVMQSLADMSIESPMPIQAQALPILLSGHDLIGIARTGSGKTLAFLLPAVVHIEVQKPVQRGENDPLTPLALIFAPTRELAVQIAEEAGKLLDKSEAGNHPGGIWASCVYGGRNKAEQLRELRRGCHIIAATPGRLTDYVSSGELSLHRVTYLVLDEADRMLDFGFADEVKSIGKMIRPDRHVCFFSATWPAEVQDLATGLCQNAQEPVRISVGQREDGAAATRADIVQEVVVFDQEDWEERDALKQEYLYKHLRTILQDADNKALVFVNNKGLADELRDKLAEEGFKTDSMHGGRKQYERLEVLDSFKRSEIRLLVATDVMGRGLDIPEISHIVLYDMGDVDDYVHRIGRTARGLNASTGHALTLFEYNQKWPELAGGLVKVLDDAGQPVPDELRAIAKEVEDGERKVVGKKHGKKWKSEWSGDSWNNSDWKSEKWKSNGDWKGGSSWQSSTWGSETSDSPANAWKRNGIALRPSWQGSW